MLVASRNFCHDPGSGAAAQRTMSHQKLFLLYLPTSLLLPAFLCWYLGRDLRSLFNPARWVTYALVALMFLVGMPASLALIFWSEQDRSPIRPLVTWGFYAFGYLLTVDALLLLRDATRLMAFVLSRLCTRFFRRLELFGGRRLRAIGRSSTWVVLVLAGICVWLGHRAALLPPQVVRVDAPIHGLPEAFRGYRIAHLTDIHIRGAIDRERIQRLVAQVNALDVDLIALTGDVVDGPLDNLAAELYALGALRAHQGIYVAVGNHENYAGVDDCVRIFQELGFHVLLNAHELIHKGSGQLVIAGVTNPQRGMHGAKYTLLQGRVAQMQSDPKIALRGAPNGIPRILLAHQPKSIAEARGLGVDLALAGHTHGGQFFPWGLAIALVFPYAAGRYVDGSMLVYVGRGIGTFGPELRLGSPPEIAVIELVQAR